MGYKLNVSDASVDEIRSLSADSLLLRKGTLEAKIEGGKQSAYIPVIIGLTITCCTYFIKDVIPTWGILNPSTITTLGILVYCAIGFSSSLLFLKIIREVARDVLELKFVEKRIADLEKVKQKRESRLEQKYSKKQTSASSPRQHANR
ncbi:hypothetical protein QJ48_14440 [Paenibacillus sp. A3]|uniref:hypothetical protein n=1 Tax=Paenibacillus sp. A3 TaxID=1337054 RepID=UPI0006D588C8|nr:hypothetical protein [Paenibacillus sp. A3]KPV58794.1 hypothetical protein QJ48_14440 [Paenibacillus sp. A3]